MFGQSSFHIEIHPWASCSTLTHRGLPHGPHELEAADVDEGAHNEHGDVKCEVVPAKQGHDGEVETVGPKDHVPVEGQGLSVLPQDLARTSGTLLSFLFSKCFHSGNYM